MTTVTLKPPLRERAGGRADHEISGATVGEVLRTLEQRHERVTGWILDEHGHVRSHVCVFLDGERVREDAPVSASDRLFVLPSISGGKA
jgi:sulfur-carrier protein